ncbi:hypothetical protein BKA69DRAFT_1128947 [Paraphysoderma sedebokerense]|nr:hypothetical protein BKA69DRAFT_1128947 [Paraphysoderma sedebokerense]
MSYHHEETIAAVCVVLALEGIFSLINNKGISYLYKSPVYIYLTVANILSAVHGYFILGFSSWLNLDNPGLMFLCMLVIDSAEICYYIADFIRLKALTDTGADPKLYLATKVFTAFGIIAYIWDFIIWDTYSNKVLWTSLMLSNPIVTIFQLIADFGLAYIFVISVKTRLVMHKPSEIKHLIYTVVISEAIIAVISLIFTVYTFIPYQAITSSLQVLALSLKCRVRYHEFQVLTNLFKEPSGKGASNGGSVSVLTKRVDNSAKADSIV